MIVQVKDIPEIVQKSEILFQSPENIKQSTTFYDCLGKLNTPREQTTETLLTSPLFIATLGSVVQGFF